MSGPKSSERRANRELREVLSVVDPRAPYPREAIRVPRGKSGGRQTVAKARRAPLNQQVKRGGHTRAAEPQQFGGGQLVGRVQ